MRQMEGHYRQGPLRDLLLARTGRKEAEEGKDGWVPACAGMTAKERRNGR
jgi:hypothetical protein